MFRYPDRPYIFAPTIVFFLQTLQSIKMKFWWKIWYISILKKIFFLKSPYQPSLYFSGDDTGTQLFYFCLPNNALYLTYEMYASEFVGAIYVEC